MNPLIQAWRGLMRNRREAAIVLAVAMLLLALLALTHGWWDEIKTALEQTNPYLFFALVCVLPLGGMSIALLYVVVGARFGGPVGLAIVAAATLVHLVGSHLIAHSVLRRFVERGLQRRRYRLPDLARREPVALALLGALIPGIPYVARNYLLALSGVPLRIYAPICWPVYVIRSGVAIFLGDWAGDLTVERVAILVVVFSIKVGICAAIVWHLYRKHGKPGRTAPHAAQRPRVA